MEEWVSAAFSPGPGQMCKSERPTGYRNRSEKPWASLESWETRDNDRWSGQPSSPHEPRPASCATAGSPAGSHAVWLSALGQPPAVPPASPLRPPGPQKAAAPPGGTAGRVRGEMHGASGPGISRFLPLRRPQTLPPFPTSSLHLQLSPRSPQAPFSSSWPPSAPHFPPGIAFQGHIPPDHTYQ